MGFRAVFAFWRLLNGAETGVFRVWSDTWSDVWSDRKKRNVQFGVTFGVTVLTWKNRYCPLPIARKSVIDVVFGCLRGGDNPTFRGVFRLCRMRGMQCLSGFVAVLYLSMAMNVRA